jgi:Tol biopolymer transport system component
VVLLALLLGGLFAPPSSAVPVAAVASQPALVGQSAAQPLSMQAAKKKPRAILTASAVVVASGKVRVSVTSNAKKVKLTYRSAKNKKRTATIKIRKGAGAKTLLRGSKKIYATALKTKALRASQKARVTVLPVVNATQGALVRVDVRPDGSPIWAPKPDRHYRAATVGAPIWSPDGNKVAFPSCAWDSACQWFVKSLATGEIVMVSSNSTGEPAVSGAYAGDWTDAYTDVVAWSRDGSQIVLSSNADNLAPGPRPIINGAYLYLKDLNTGMVSRILEPNDGRLWFAGQAIATTAGLKVTFATSMADTSRWYAILDIASGTWLLREFVDQTGVPSGIGPVSPAGDLYVEWTGAAHFAPATVRIRRMATGEQIAEIVLPPLGGAAGFSADGSSLLIAEPSCPDPTVTPCTTLKRFEVATGQMTTLLTPAGPRDYVYAPSVSPDGARLVFQHNSSDPASTFVPDDTNRRQDVVVKDLMTGTFQRASVDSSGVQNNSDSVYPVWSPDGTRILFKASGTAWAGADRLTHVYIKTMQ